MYINRIEPFPIMKYLQIYLICSVLLYVFGPISWVTHYPLLTFVLIAAYQFSLYAGYKAGLTSADCHQGNSIFSKSWFIKNYFVLAFIVIIIGAMMMMRIAMLYGFSDISSLVETAFTSASDIYNDDKLVDTGSQMFGGTILSLLYGFMGPITILFMPTTIIFFRELSFSKKVIGIIACVILSLSKAVAGTNEGFFEPITLLLVGLILKPKQSNVGKKKRSFAWLWIIIGVIGIITMFNLVMSDRNGEHYEFSQLGENSINYNSVIFQKLPDDMQKLIIWFTFYLCQGYYGMSLALAVSEWTPLCGLGFSSYIRVNAEKILGFDATPYTLMAGTNPHGWMYGVNWHSAYTWFASDVWWLGVPIILYFIGKLFAQTFKEASYDRNPVSIGMFTLLLMLIIFIPMNTKIFANSDSFFAFFFYLFALKYRKKPSTQWPNYR